MFYLMTLSTHFIYGYMASNIWLRTILIVRKETRCRHIGYSFWLTAWVLLYAPSHRQHSTYHSLCYTRLEREIAQWVHPMKDRSDDPSHHEQTLLPRSYISLSPKRLHGPCFWWSPPLVGPLGYNLVSLMDNATLWFITVLFVFK